MSCLFVYLFTYLFVCLLHSLRAVPLPPQPVWKRRPVSRRIIGNDGRGGVVVWMPQRLRREEVSKYETALSLTQSKFGLSAHFLYHIHHVLKHLRSSACKRTRTGLIYTFNPFTPESDQCQISPPAPPEILHHTVRSTWLFIAYSDVRWL